MSRARLACSLAALVVGCGAAPAPKLASMPAPPPSPPPVVLPAATTEDPPAATGAAPLEGSRASGPERPPTQTLRFDVDTLPVATWAEALPEAGFSLRKVGDTWNLWVRTTIFAEVIVTAAGRSSDEGTMPVGFTGFTGGSFGEGDVPACGRGHSGRRLAVWNGFASAGWTDDGLDVEMEEGDFDLATCRGTPVHSLRGRASAVVPGYVYALRERDEDDDGNDRESLVLFLPRGTLVSAAADPRSPLGAADTGTFTRLTFPMARGTAGSASLRVSPAALALWARLRHGRPAPFSDGTGIPEDLLVGVDVAWQGDVRVGSLSVAVPKAKASYRGLLAAAQKAGAVGVR
ncbi:MAG TPA: hypothetical protein VGL81_36530 [Polyangiaceae bacterium]